MRRKKSKLCLDITFHSLVCYRKGLEVVKGSRVHRPLRAGWVLRVAPLTQIDSVVLYVEVSTKSTENVCKSRDGILINIIDVLVIWKPARCNLSPSSPQRVLRHSFWQFDQEIIDWNCSWVVISPMVCTRRRWKRGKTSNRKVLYGDFLFASLVTRLDRSARARSLPTSATTLFAIWHCW